MVKEDDLEELLDYLSMKQGLPRPREDWKRYFREQGEAWYRRPMAEPEQGQQQSLLAGGATGDGLNDQTTPSVLGQPDTVQPDTVQPDTVQPDTVQPDTVQPDTVQPDTVQPDTVQPDKVQPGTVQPGKPDDRPQPNNGVQKLPEGGGENSPPAVKYGPPWFPPDSKHPLVAIERGVRGGCECQVWICVDFQGV